MLYGIDISHHQDDAGPINFDLLRGHIDFIITKVTEGTSYVDPTANAHVAEARRIGVIPGVYHFARGGDPTLEANWFMSKAPDLSGAFIALDWEISHPNPVAWSLAWLTAVKNHYGTPPLVYVNKSTVAQYDWTPVVNANHGLWLADYDGNPSDFSETGEWPCIAIKQYTSTGRLPGIAGNVDQDSFNGDRAQLLRYCIGTAPAPVAPPPPPVAPWTRLPVLGYGMRLSDAVARLQRFLAVTFPAYKTEHGDLPATGNYLDVTRAWVLEFQKRAGVRNGDGSSPDGKTVGKNTNAALWQYGYRG